MKRTPMKRGAGFKRPERTQRTPIVLRPVQRSGVYAASTAVVVALPKGELAKPGKGAPTVEEKKWLQAIVSFGCVACWLDGSPRREPEVHHILRGGVRMGHLYSLPLCSPGHHRNGQMVGMVSRHPWRRRFEARYATEQQLLNRLQTLLGFPLLAIEASK